MNERRLTCDLDQVFGDLGGGCRMEKQSCSSRRLAGRPMSPGNRHRRYLKMNLGRGAPATTKQTSVPATKVKNELRFLVGRYLLLPHANTFLETELSGSVFRE